MWKQWKSEKMLNINGEANEKQHKNIFDSLDENIPTPKKGLWL